MRDCIQADRHRGCFFQRLIGFQTVRKDLKAQKSPNDKGKSLECIKGLWHLQIRTVVAVEGSSCEQQVLQAHPVHDSGGLAAWVRSMMFATTPSVTSSAGRA